MTPTPAIARAAAAIASLVRTMHGLPKADEIAAIITSELSPLTEANGPGSINDAMGCGVAIGMEVQRKRVAELSEALAAEKAENVRLRTGEYHQGIVPVIAERDKLRGALAVATKERDQLQTALRSVRECLVSDLNRPCSITDHITLGNIKEAHESIRDCVEDIDAALLPARGVGEK